MTELLISVRSAEEADAALLGGAHVIDVKEPRHGSLGRAMDAVINEVWDRVGRRRPVSAALGEISDGGHLFPTCPLEFAKWGLAHCARNSDWREQLIDAAHQLKTAVPACAPVVVGYADWGLALAPSPDEVCSFACQNQWGAFLLDTWKKDGTSLLDWMSSDEIARLCHNCRDAGIRVALAGSLGLAELIRLRSIQPDWFAVRGAVCPRHDRNSTVAPNLVRELVRLLQESNVGS